jgi:DNA replication protein DnaC
LIDDLSAASCNGRLRESLAHYQQPHVLVVDEVGYLTYGPDAANVLFHVVNDRHLKKRPIGPRRAITPYPSPAAT